MKYRENHKSITKNMVVFNYIDYNPIKFSFEERTFIADIMVKLEYFANRIQDKVSDKDLLNKIIMDTIDSFCYSKTYTANIGFNVSIGHPFRYYIECDEFGYTLDNGVVDDYYCGSKPNLKIKNMTPERTGKMLDDFRKDHPDVDYINLMIYSIKIE